MAQGGGNPPDPAALLAATRKSVADSCDALTSRHTTLKIFDESKASAGYEPWRTALIEHIRPAGADFVAALITGQTIPAVADYDDNLVLDDTVAARVPLTMPQIRQVALLSTIRAALPADGESLRLIAGCKHAGGQIQTAAGPIDQALLILDKRWRGALLPAVSVADDARLLYTSPWPSEFSVDAYTSFFNAAVSRAGRCGVNPAD